MRKIAISMLLACSLHAQQTAVAALGATLGGVLNGDDGSSIVGATVHLERLPPYPPGAMWTKEAATASGSGGSFSFQNLLPGNYRLCAQAPGTAWLNPCEWGPTNPTASISASQTALSITVVMSKGAVVPIRVNDPGQLLAQNEGTTPGAHLLLGVGNDANVFRPAFLSSTDSGGQTYQILIQFNRSLSLVVSSAFFHLANATGTPLPLTGSTFIPVLVPSGQTPATITLAVIGAG